MQNWKVKIASILENTSLIYMKEIEKSRKNVDNQDIWKFIYFTLI